MRPAPSEAEPIEAFLARFAHELRSEDVGARAHKAFERLLLDYVAVAVAGLGDATCAQAADTFGGLSSPASGAPAAAFAHGTCAHWFDWDDTHDESHVHGGAVIFPALLALWKAGVVAPNRHAAQELLLCTLAGYDVACRIGGALRRHGSRGWMPTGSGATLGAAAAGARLAGADPNGIRSAMGIAAANAGLSRQALADKVNAKGTLAGVAAKTAVEAVMLSLNGVQGPPRFLSGRYGLGALHAANQERLWDDIAEARSHFYAEEVSIKPYPCCRSTHAVIDAVLALRKGAPAVAEQVTRMSVLAPPGIVERCGAPFTPGDNPRLAAQFSIPYTAALALRHGRIGLADFSSAAIDAASGEMRALMDSILVTCNEIEDDLMAPVDVAFGTAEKTLAQRTVKALRGDPGAPLSDDEQRQKLQTAAHGLLLEGDVVELESSVRRATTESPEALIACLASVGMTRTKPP